MPNLLQINYVDTDGETATSRHWVDETVTDEANDPETLWPELEAITSAQIQNADIIFDTELAGEAATDGPYDVADKAVLYFRDSAGFTQKLSVPAPEASIFETDDETVDKSNSLVQDFVTEVLIYLVTRGGAALVEFIKGRRMRKNRKGK